VVHGRSDLLLPELFAELEELMAEDSKLSLSQVLDKLIHSYCDHQDDSCQWLRTFLPSSSPMNVSRLFEQHVLDGLRAATESLSAATSLGEEASSEQPLAKLRKAASSSFVQLEIKLLQSLLEQLQQESTALQRMLQELEHHPPPAAPKPTLIRVLDKLVQWEEADVARLERALALRVPLNDELARLRQLQEQVVGATRSNLTCRLLQALAPFELAQLDEEGTSFCLNFDSPVRGLKTSVQLNAAGDVTAVEAQEQDAVQEEVHDADSWPLLSPAHPAARFYRVMHTLLLSSAASKVLQQQQQERSNDVEGGGFLWLDVVLRRLELATLDLSLVVAKGHSVAVAPSSTRQDAEGAGERRQEEAVSVDVYPLPISSSAVRQDSHSTPDRIDVVRFAYEASAHPLRCLQYSLPSSVSVWRGASVVDPPSIVVAASSSACTVQATAGLYQTVCKALWINAGEASRRRVDAV